MKCSLCKNDIEIYYSSPFDIEQNQSGTFSFECRHCNAKAFKTHQFSDPYNPDLIQMHERFIRYVYLMRADKSEFSFKEHEYRLSLNAEIEKMRKYSCISMINQKEYFEKLEELNNKYFA